MGEGGLLNRLFWGKLAPWKKVYEIALLGALNIAIIINFDTITNAMLLDLLHGDVYVTNGFFITGPLMVYHILLYSMIAMQLIYSGFAFWLTLKDGGSLVRVLGLTVLGMYGIGSVVVIDNAVNALSFRMHGVDFPTGGFIPSADPLVVYRIALYSLLALPIIYLGIIFWLLFSKKEVLEG